MQKRIRESAILNSQYQEIRDWGDDLASMRDAENCFRIVELGIPKGEKVTVLASPRVLPGG